MKRILIIFTLVYLTLIMAACNSDEVSPLIIKDTDTESDIIEDDNIIFNIEQTILAKGFQNLDPKVEIQKKEDGFRLLASLGLFETSGVHVTNINKSGNEIDIHVENKFSTFENQLAIPQVIIELKDLSLRSVENYTFNIINENYQPIKVKLSANEVINKVNSDFQIVTNTSPAIDMTKKGDKLFWELNYENILDKHNPETPVVDMSVIVDANSGELVESSKKFISALIDEGSILDYIPKEYILYIKDDKNLSEQNKGASIWLYDIKNNTKKVLYSTSSKIISAKHNPNLDSISILESVDGANRLYILGKEDVKPYRAVFDSSVNPLIVRWKDNSNIYILSKSDGKSTIYNYNIEEATSDLVTSIYSDVTGIQVQNDEAILTVRDKESEGSLIRMTSDWINFKIEKEGHSPIFISDKYLGVLKLNEKTETNELLILNKDDGSIYSNLDLNVTNYYKIDENTIGIISSNQKNNDFTFHKYNIADKELEGIVNISSSQAYYDTEKQVLYIDLKVPFESDKPQIIYSLNLDKNETTEP